MLTALHAIIIIIIVVNFCQGHMMGHTEGEACKRAPQEYRHTYIHKIVIYIQHTYSEQR